MKAIAIRRSVRKHQRKEVDNGLIDKLLTESECMQIMDSLQPYSVIITHSDGQKRRLAPAHSHQPMVAQAPVVLTFYAGFRRASIRVECRRAQPDYDSFLSFINAATDALLCCQTFYNFTGEVRLDLCFLDATLYGPKSIIDTPQLLRLVMPIATITLEWPNEVPELSDRLPLSAIICDETYQDYTPERADQFYHEKESLPENTQSYQVNEKEALAQVFTDIRYTKKDNETMSKNLLDTLKQQGFLQKPRLENGLTYR